MTINPVVRFLITGLVLVLLAGCGYPNVSAPATEPELPSGIISYHEYNNNGTSFSIPVPENWSVSSESERQGTITVKLSSNDDEKTHIIVVIAPSEMAAANLVQTAERLLTSSLYQPGAVSKQTQRIANQSVQIITAAAGENVVARTAAFSGKGRSFFLTLITRESTFDDSVPTLELIIYNLK